MLPRVGVVAMDMSIRATPTQKPMGPKKAVVKIRKSLYIRIPSANSIFAKDKLVSRVTAA